jgi:predicted nuclease of predicted toxin-antitoxin system
MSIKFLLDENIPYALIDLLQERGFDVQHLKKMGKQGAKNGEVYEIAENERSWIVTRDADFQNLRRFYRYNVGGIILFKLTRSKTEHLLSAMVRLLDKQKDKFTEKNLIIVEDYEIKIYEG